jgi:hypothetical protein
MKTIPMQRYIGIQYSTALNNVYLSGDTLYNIYNTRLASTNINEWIETSCPSNDTSASAHRYLSHKLITNARTYSFNL